MPYFNFTQEIGKPDLVTEEILGIEPEASFFLSTSAAEGLRSSRVADITGGVLLQILSNQIMQSFLSTLRHA
jgi:hypothetical protein